MKIRKKPPARGCSTHRVHSRQKQFCDVGVDLAHAEVLTREEMCEELASLLLGDVSSLLHRLLEVVQFLVDVRFAWNHKTPLLTQREMLHFKTTPLVHQGDTVPYNALLIYTIVPSVHFVCAQGAYKHYHT